MADHRRLEIDKAGVLDVGARLRSDADKDITPRSDRIKQQLMWHSVFGERSGSPVVQHAVTQYYAQMRAAIDNLDTLIYNVSVFAQATEDVVAAYEHADALSATDANAILLGASTKTGDAEAAALEASRAAAAQERKASLDEIRKLHNSKSGGA